MNALVSLQVLSPLSFSPSLSPKEEGFLTLSFLEYITEVEEVEQEETVEDEEEMYNWDVDLTLCDIETSGGDEREGEGEGEEEIEVKYEGEDEGELEGERESEGDGGESALIGEEEVSEGERVGEDRQVVVEEVDGEFEIEVKKEGREREEVVEVVGGIVMAAEWEDGLSERVDEVSFCTTDRGMRVGECRRKEAGGERGRGEGRVSRLLKGEQRREEEEETEFAIGESEEVGRE